MTAYLKGADWWELVNVGGSIIRQLGPGLIIALLHSRGFMGAYNPNTLSPTTLKTRQKIYQERCFHPF
jgi:hypothetical protein